MGANVCSSTTSTVVAVTTDTVFSATYSPASKCPDSAGQVVVMVKFTKGANNLALTFDVINKSLHATDKYRMMFITDDDTTGIYTVTLTASGNYRIPLNLIEAEKTLIANLTFAGTGGTDIAVINFMEG